MVKRYMPRLWIHLSPEEKIEKLHKDNEQLRGEIDSLEHRLEEINNKLNSALSLLAQAAGYVPR